MRYYVIAGEASGDLHASRLIRAIKQNDNDASIRAWGGDLMENEGVTLIKHYKDLAFMGFTEVLLNLRTILSNMKFCKQDMFEFKPDVVIFVDYPGFNIPMATFAKKNGFKTAYYISPQIWAWKEKRVHTIKKVVDKMMVILPFEKDFYKKWNYEVEYVGHPLIEIIDGFRNSSDLEKIKKEIGLIEHKKVVALLPGSRIQEIKKKLPVMLEATREFPDLLFILAQATSLSDDLIKQYTRDYPKVRVIKNQTYELLSIADAALVTSGTATLETALFNVPEVVCYKGSPISYQIGKRLIKVPFIALVNLIMGKKVVQELIQDDLTSMNIKKELQQILYPGPERESMIKDFNELHSLLSAGGSASFKAAEVIKKLVLQ
jgi:lipid-A-disaccharide synthase